MENIYLELLNKAKEASEYAYCPYSKFSVGACVLYESKQKYCGCNVENASYGLVLCAERNAISTAIAQGEVTKIKAIAIYSPQQKKCMPCGACRQWLSEFAGDDVEIILEDENSKPVVLSLNEIFPFGFKLEK
mgnify:CR=1 FL=1